MPLPDVAQPDSELAHAAAAGCARPVLSGLVDGRARGAQFVCLSAQQQNCPAHDSRRQYFGHNARMCVGRFSNDKVES